MAGGAQAGARAIVAGLKGEGFVQASSQPGCMWCVVTSWGSDRRAESDQMRVTDDEPATAALGRRRLAANEAMDRYARGEADGFERLYELVADELWAFIYARLRHQASAEDIMQQTLLHIHHARGRFREGANVHPWMFTIAWRLIIDRRRRCREALDVDGLDLADGRAAPDDQVSAIELGGRLEMAFGELPERQQAALELVRVAGLSHKETAQALGTSEAAVKSLLHRALVALRDSTMEEA